MGGGFVFFFFVEMVFRFYGLVIIVVFFSVVIMMVLGLIVFEEVGNIFYVSILLNVVIEVYDWVVNNFNKVFYNFG